MKNPCIDCKMTFEEKAACCGCPERLVWEKHKKPIIPPEADILKTYLESEDENESISVYLYLKRLAKALNIEFLIDDRFVGEDFFVDTDENGEQVLYLTDRNGKIRAYDDRGELCKAFMNLVCKIYPNVEGRDKWEYQ